MNNTLEDWVANGDGPRSIEQDAIDAGLLASARVILGGTDLSASDVLAYLRHCAAIHRGQGTDPATLAKRLVAIEKESCKPMTAAEWKEFQKQKEQAR